MSTNMLQNLPDIIVEDIDGSRVKENLTTETVNKGRVWKDDLIRYCIIQAFFSIFSLSLSLSLSFILNFFVLPYLSPTLLLPLSPSVHVPNRVSSSERCASPSDAMSKENIMFSQHNHNRYYMALAVSEFEPEKDVEMEIAASSNECQCKLIESINSAPYLSVKDLPEDHYFSE